MKKKSIFSVIYLSIISFIFFFSVQINALDTIKNIFNKGIETAKNGYNWLTNNKKIIYKNNYINQEIKHTKSLESNFETISINSKDKIDKDLQNSNNDKEEILHNVNDSDNNKNSTEKLENKNITDTNFQYQNNIIDDYINLLQERNSINNADTKKIKNDIIARIEKNPEYITIIKNKTTNLIKKQIEKSNNIKLKKNSALASNQKISTEKNDASINLANKDEEIQKKLMIENIENGKKKDNEEKKQIEQLLMHSSKNNRKKSNQNISNNEQFYKKKYFYLLAELLNKSILNNKALIDNKNNIKSIK